MKHFGKWNGDRCMHLVSEMSYKFLHSIMCFLNTLQKSKGVLIYLVLVRAILIKNAFFCQVVINYRLPLMYKFPIVNFHGKLGKGVLPSLM